MRRLLALLAVSMLWTSFAIGQIEPGQLEAPPVRKVVLYKHGMGYIEREGKIKDNAIVTLAFRSEQMKDLLTSFFAMDLDGGKISSVQYETRDPLSKQLQDILITVPEQAALSQFLAQLKGARLSARAAGETLQGRVLGIEPVSEIVGGQSVQKGYRLVLLTDSGPIRSLDLFAIAELSLADEALQRDLRRLLDLSLDSKYSNRKKLAVAATGKGERTLRIGYLIEMPVWKCSYRVIFDEKKKDAPVLLQGWALAENTTEDDWRDVSISFVAGNPISYVMDLYSPYYVQRPRVPIPGLENLSVDWKAASPPDLDEGSGMGEHEEKAVEARPGRKSKASRGPHAIAQTMDAAPAPVAIPQEASRQPSKSATELLASSFDTSVSGARVGELFSYEAKERVMVPRGRAAMIPIVSKPIHGRKVLYYKASFSSKPTNAFVVRNDTDSTLEAGAVTFFEGSTSLGEGILSHTLPPGSQEVVPYSFNASVDVTPEALTRREPHFKGRLVAGVLTLTSVEVLTQKWRIVNRGKEPTVLWLNQPKSPGFRLTRPEKPLKEVDSHYRFEVPLKEGESLDYVVEEKRDVQETVQLSKSGEEQIRFYMSQSYLSSGARGFLKELGGIMAEKAALQRQITEWTQQTQRLTEEQARLRANLDSVRSAVPKEQELRARWVASLAGNEEQLADRRGKLDEAGDKMRRLDDLLAGKIRDYKDE